MPGSANDAFSAFTRLPLLSQTSCPVPSSVATATNLRSSCSMSNCWRCVLEPGAQALSGDQARAGEIEVEKAEDAAAGQAAGEVLERVEPAGDETGAGDGADRGAGDDVGLEAGSDQALQHADMRPAAGRAAAKGDANRRSCR